MTRLALTEAQEEQIRSMRKEGKTPQEIVDFFKTSYAIELLVSRVYYLTAGQKEKKAPRVKKQRKQKAAALPAMGGVFLPVVLKTLSRTYCAGRVAGLA